MSGKVWRKCLMVAAWYIKEVGDWMYFKGLGDCDYSSPSYCDHCGKWNFEVKDKHNAE